MSELFDPISQFMARGGDVLWAILAVTFLMWALILERFWYFRTGHRKLVDQVVASWDARADSSSWYAHRIREALISQVQESLEASVPVIKTLVAICPLLGLLGTVTGMISVFDVMSISGSGNARGMAAGVSQATLPTMAGMVAALSGLFFSNMIERFVDREAERVADHLVRHQE
ncbi:MAG: MotA/TolQ/ExbB proton channel family protein [Proteobacteria bacterium]|jgi:biopolymer transport protein ExbB|nr:MotA/TolQ/ExbB proton channel family protein [Pseudomonadota bacterium]